MNPSSEKCPYCFRLMAVERLHCQSCEVSIEGVFQMPSLLRLKPEQLAFVERFVMASGSLKEMAKEVGVSYPTVRSRLDRIIETLQARVPAEELRRSDILDALESGKLSADEASELIKGAR